MNEYQLFDVVYILSTKDVEWMSAPRGRPTSPKGYWNIVAIRNDGKFVLSKEETVIITTMNNIKRVASYDLDRVFEEVKDAGINKEDRNDDDRREQKREDKESDQ